MPKISVIVPVYNVEPYIHRCIDSILCQTFTDFELILVDDGSPDNCGKICDEYAKIDNRIYVIHQENRGLSAARNAGIDRAFLNKDCEWLAFVDSDDCIHQNYLEFLYNLATKNGADLSICRYTSDLNEFSKKHLNEQNSAIIKSEDFYINYTAESTVAGGKLYRKTLFNNLRYPIGKIHEDEFVTYKTVFFAKKIVFTDCPLYFYYKNDSGIMSKQFSEENLSAVAAFEEQIEFFKKNNYTRAHALVVRAYIFLLADILTSKIKLLSPEKASNQKRILRKKLKFALKNYKAIYNYDKKTWTYLAAHPFREKVLDLLGII